MKIWVNFDEPFLSYSAATMKKVRFEKKPFDYRTFNSNISRTKIGREVRFSGGESLTSATQRRFSIYFRDLGSISPKKWLERFFPHSRERSLVVLRSERKKRPRIHFSEQNKRVRLVEWLKK